MHRPDITRGMLLEYLKAEANTRGIAKVSLREIAKAIGCAHVTAKMKLDELAALGDITVESQNKKRNIITIL